MPAMEVAVEGSTTRVKSRVGRTMKWPVEVAVPPEVVTWRGPVVAPAGTVTVLIVRSSVLAHGWPSAACVKLFQNLVPLYIVP